MTDYDNMEAKSKASELFAYCMTVGPCNKCIFFNPEEKNSDPCKIGCPNSWPMFDTANEEGAQNRALILKILSFNEEE